MHSFVVGDIHGCLGSLTRLLEKCGRFAAGRPARFIFLGDYIDRGPDSAGVVELIMAMQAAEPDKVIALAGNHEDFLQRLDRPADIALWLDNGGDETLASYDAASVADLPADHLIWLRNLPTHFDDGLRFFVHAGIRPDVPLDRQTPSDLLWIREPFLSSTAAFGRLIVHGHTPTKTSLPEVRSNRINIDTGAVYGGPLTAAVFIQAAPTPVTFLQT